MIIAITREISSSMQNCELTHLQPQPIDIPLARQQHHAYEAALAALGCHVEHLPEEPDLPDSVFVEDVAIILDELAILTRPGALSRRPEVTAIISALAPYRRLVTIEAPGTLDGGDVLRIGKDLFIGISGRSNKAGVEQVREALEPHGYTVQGVPVTGCLHLKSAVSQVAEDTVLINREWIDPAIFSRYQQIEIDPSEPYAANGLLIGGTLIYPTAYPRTRQILENHAVPLQLVDITEVAKAEGAVTCCSLIVKV